MHFRERGALFVLDATAFREYPDYSWTLWRWRMNSMPRAALNVRCLAILVITVVPQRGRLPAGWRTRCQAGGMAWGTFSNEIGLAGIINTAFAMRVNYVLIDFENVQPSSLAELDADHFRVLVFVGANQNKVSFDTAVAMQRLGTRAAYVKIAGNGTNALDFHIAFHIGQLCVQDPSAFFHIISKDTGFDPLVQHLRERKLYAGRFSDVADIPLLKAANSKTIAEKVALVVANFQRKGPSKPRTLKTLKSTIDSLFQKQLTEGDLAAVVKGLESEGLVSINEGQVTYALPSGEAQPVA